MNYELSILHSPLSIINYQLSIKYIDYEKIKFVTFRFSFDKRL